MKRKNKGGFYLVETIIILLGFAILGMVFWYIFRHKTNITSNNQVTSNVAEGSYAFNYGFDFSNYGPDSANFNYVDRNNVASSVAAAVKVLDLFPGIMMDQSLYSFGSSINPEPSNGQYDLSGLTPRLNLISQANGITVMTLINSPSWMHPGVSSINQPPDPQYYQDYANLCAYVAKSFPQIKYFVVWSEMRNFKQYAPANNGAADYTQMYNQVYKAIKAVRPDAMIGGPYADMTSMATPYPNTATSTLHGAWGFVNPSMQDAFVYWLQHKVGADFVAVDGATEIAKANNANLTDIVTASQKYAAVDQWIKSQTSLPIWWMESHIAPQSGWNPNEGSAARIATLILMNTSGASVGMQWQPQNQQEYFKGINQTWPDEGLWTETNLANGGQMTTLAQELIQYLPILRQRLILVSNQAKGVLVAKNSANTYIVDNTNSTLANAQIGSSSVTLQSFQVYSKSL